MLVTVSRVLEWPGCGARLRARSLWHAAKWPNRPVVCCWIAMVSESTRIVYMYVYVLCLDVDCGQRWMMLRLGEHDGEEDDIVS